MDCKQARLHLNDLIDDNLEDDVRKEILEHLKQCEACQKEFDTSKQIKEALATLNPPELPQGFHEALMGELRRASEPRKGFFKKNYQWIAGIAAVFLLGIIITGIQGISPLRLAGQSNEMAMDFAPQAEMPEEEPGAAAKGAFESDMTMEEAGYPEERGTPEAPRKIIRNVSMEVETSDIEAVYRLFSQQVVFYGGFVEQGSIGDYYFSYYEKIQDNARMRNAQITARIPADDLEAMIAFVEDHSEVKSVNTSTQDQTEYYYDVDAQVENLKVREDRLRELMAKAEDIDDILSVENELYRVRSEIDALTRNLKNIDSRVDLSTLYISMREVEDSGAIASPDRSLSEEIREGFIRNINRIIRFTQDAIVYVVSYLPILVLVGLTGVMGLWILKKINRRMRR